MKNLLNIISCVGVFCTFITRAQTNVDFESTSPGTYTGATSVSGWLVSSQTLTSCNTSTSWTSGSSEFSVVSTPVISFPTIGNISNSPLGGNNIARLNNSSANSSSTKLSRSISVNNSNTLLQFAWAGVWEDGNHSCCEQAGFSIILKDTLGFPLPCASLTANAVGSNCPATGVTTFSVTNWFMWSNWQVKYVDLTPYLGQNISIEITCADCIYGTHYGTLFFDLKTGGQLLPGDLYPLPNPNVSYVHFCPGSSIATIDAPLGYSSYSWTAPSGYPISPSQATLSTLSLTNALPGNIYTVTLLSPAGCQFFATYTLNTTTVGIAGLASSSTCAGGASGSATVVANGSGTGYNYLWSNTSNSVISTSQVVNGLSPGIYSITITASGTQSASCGTVVSTVTVNTAPSGVINMIKPFCGTEAYLGVNSGSNYQWYNSLGAISASLGGTASSYTVTSASNNMIYSVRYLSPQGCQDSIRYTLVATTPGTVGVSYNKLICPGASNGSVVVSMIPAAGSPPASNSFSVFSTGTATPVYSAAVNSSSSYSFSANNLSAGGTYSVIAFDGACKYSTSFSVTGYTFNYTLTPNNSPTICAGSAIAAGVTFSTAPALTQYSYSWSPSTFLIGTNYQTTIISPTLSVGTVTTIIYTVVATPSVVNCPLTKTISITAANPAAPIISPVPALCKNSSTYALSASPPGGTFSINSALTPGGLLTPSLAVSGTSTFTYAISVGSCVAISTATYVVNNLPIISISGNTSICEGQSTTLLASGTNNYLWNTNVSGPLLTVSPSVTTNYVVVGTNVVNSCTNSANINIQVLPLPQLNIIGDTAICQGETTTLTADGASLYNWSNGSSNQNITLSPLTNTTYTLIGTSGTGCINSKIIVLSVSPCTGINTINSDQNHIKIYPNPNKGKLIIESSEPGEISIYEFTGKMIRTEKLMSRLQLISVDDLENGIYILKSIIGNKMITTKLVKE